MQDKQEGRSFIQVSSRFEDVLHYLVTTTCKCRMRLDMHAPKPILKSSCEVHSRFAFFKIFFKCTEFYETCLILRTIINFCSIQSSKLWGPGSDFDGFAKWCEHFWWFWENLLDRQNDAINGQRTFLAGQP